MQIILQLITNKIFLGAASAWFVAQLAKVVIDTIKNGFSKERLTGGGGMPSSHSATVIGLLTITTLIYGTGSFEFVMALFFAIIVIYDALNVRYETQRQGKALNDLNNERVAEGKSELKEVKFKEKLGHTGPEVVAGVIIGLVCGIIVNMLPF